MIDASPTPLFPRVVDAEGKVCGRLRQRHSLVLVVNKISTMKLFSIGIFAALFAATLAIDNHEHNKIVCFWNSTSFHRFGAAKFQVEDLRPALGLCTHLIYGYAGINADTCEAVPLNPSLDTGAGYAYYRLVTQLKRSFTDLKIYLSIGGNADPYEDTHKYLRITETTEDRNKFINSVVRLLNDYEFDGLDLAWQFPEAKVKKNRGTFGSLWHGIKKTFGYGKFKDDKEEEHKNGFSNLVRDLKNRLAQRSKALTLSVLPHINSSIYYDARYLQPHLDAVHLHTFNQKTPERTPKEADFPAPIYESYGRVAEDNIDASVRFWLEHGVPGSKIVIGVPTFARTWKMTSESGISGVPPIVTDGAGAEGPQTQIPGLLSYPEVCAKLTESAVDRVRRVNDPSKKYGSYAYRTYDDNTGAEGIWVGFEDPDTAGIKATYARNKGLGGVAVVDISLDDFRGTCTGDKFPIVRAIKLKF